MGYERGDLLGNLGLMAKIPIFCQLINVLLIVQSVANLMPLSHRKCIHIISTISLDLAGTLY